MKYKRISETILLHVELETYPFWRKTGLRRQHLDEWEDVAEVSPSRQQYMTLHKILYLWHQRTVEKLWCWKHLQTSCSPRSLWYSSCTPQMQNTERSEPEDRRLKDFQGVRVCGSHSLQAIFKFWSSTLLFKGNCWFWYHRWVTTWHLFLLFSSQRCTLRILDRLKLEEKQWCVAIHIWSILLYIW